MYRLLDYSPIFLNEFTFIIEFSAYEMRVEKELFPPDFLYCLTFYQGLLNVIPESVFYSYWVMSTNKSYVTGSATNPCELYERLLHNDKVTVRCAISAILISSKKINLPTYGTITFDRYVTC